MGRGLLSMAVEAVHCTIQKPPLCCGLYERKSLGSCGARAAHPWGGLAFRDVHWIGGWWRHVVLRTRTVSVVSPATDTPIPLWVEADPLILEMRKWGRVSPSPHTVRAEPELKLSLSTPSPEL